MGESPFRKRPDEGDDDGTERPTVTPPFDPLELARRSLSPAGQRLARRPAITLTDPDEMEVARLQSIPTLPPPLTAPPARPGPGARGLDGPASAASSLAALEDALEELAPATRAVPDALGDAIAAAEARNDHEHALVLAEQLLSGSPRDPKARAAADRARAGLRASYLDALGSLDGVPVLLTARQAMVGLELDHRAGFLLSHVDGASSFETILDVSGMPELDALRILHGLLLRGIVGVRP